jgi:DNA-binding Xre family transcriptional regulator
MLQLNIAAMLRNKGIDKPYAWLCKQKITPRIAQKLIAGEQKLLPIRVVNIICTAAYCTPNDLFAWQPDANQIIDEAHPLQKLRARAISKLGDKLKKLTPEQIAELERMADELGKE